MLLMATLGIQVLVATVYANLFEWLWHKHVYHGLGKKKKSWFSGHWRDHHRVVRKSKGFDLSYNNRLFVGKDPTLEAVQLFVAASLHLPLLPLAPAFVATLYFHALMYFVLHRKSHLDPEWAKKYLPWHYDHHMGKNQDANWCVTYPLWDHILRTREHFINKKLDRG